MKLKKLVASMAILLSAFSANAALVDGHFSTNQIFDVQYYWSGTTLNASSFIAPYDMNFTHPTLTSGQYFAFFNSTTNPGTYGLGVYNADGTRASIVHNTGTLQAIGPDAIFYIGSGFFGTVITTSAGYAYGASASFASMDTSVSSSDASSYTWASTTPLSAGQTASSGSSTPTVVSTTAGTPIVTTSSVVGATTTTTTTSGVASEDKAKQTITTTTTVATSTPTTTTTCTTPTTITTYSDSTTTTTNGSQSCSSSTTYAPTSSSTVDAISGRIDQMSVLSDLNKQLDRGLNMDAFRSDGMKQGDLTLYVNGNASKSTLNDSYNAKGNGWGLGIEKQVKHNWRLGIQYNRVDTTLSGIDSGTSQNKDHTGLYSVYNINDVVVVNNLGYSKNDISTNRTVGGVFNNNYSTTGDNVWLNNRVYAPQYKNFRPFAGVTTGRSTVGGYTESGSLVTARTVSTQVTDYTYGEAGLRYDNKVGKFIFGGEVGTTTDEVTTGAISIGYAPTGNGVITLAVGTQNYKGINTNSASIRGIIRF